MIRTKIFFSLLSGCYIGSSIVYALCQLYPRKLFGQAVALIREAPQVCDVTPMVSCVKRDFYDQEDSNFMCLE